jgi:putative endopeptidase
MALQQNDFYLYINADWLNNNPIPNDYSQWGSFNVLANETLLKLKDILDNDKIGDNDWNKVRILWCLGNDDNTLNHQNINDILNPYVTQILNIQSTTELINFMFDTNICTTPFNLEVESDLQYSDKNAIYLDCCGLGLPDKDMYLIPEMEDKRLKYVAYLHTLSLYIENNFTIDKINVNNVYNLEKTLADERLSRTERRDTKKLYNPYKFNELTQLLPSIDWLRQFNNLNIDINKVPYVIVTEPKYFEFLNNLFNKIDIKTWKDYLLIKLFQFASSYTNDILNEINFDFYGRTLSGQPEQKPRWKRVLCIVDSYVGEILGKKYVSKYFPESSKQLILDMIDKMKEKLSSRIINSTWLTNETKRKALYKLSKINQKIGYPDKWEDFNKLELNQYNTYFENVVQCNKWLTAKNLQKYDKLVDKDEWHMTPHTINAYYDPTKNEIVFPAGILQEPFFNPTASIASNYGGIGAVICHEITHGFDDQGCEFDADGNLNNWWTEMDKEEFNKVSKKLEEQFNSYIIEGMNINGKLTLGENIADLGGVSITLDCLKDYLYQHPEINYDTELKIFFKQWAVIWRNNIRPDEAKKKILTDPHSPGCLRVNGILKNIDDFYTIFNINENDNMYIKQENRCLIW